MRVRSLRATITAALLGAAVVVVATWATASAHGARVDAAPARTDAASAGSAVRPATVDAKRRAERSGSPPAPDPAGRYHARSTLRSTRMVAIPAGSYLPLYTDGGRTDERTAVPGFRLDEHAVTREQYAAFVAAHPEWRRSRAAASAAGAGYLAGWRGDLEYGDMEEDGARPVTQVSLPAARAYCAAQGKRLPTTDEWEYAAAAGPHRRDASSDAAFRQRLLDLYTQPRPPQPMAVRSGFRNAYGVWDLHGVVWEWTAPAAPRPMAGMHHSMHRAPAKHDLGCAGGAAGASDTRDYPSFLRYAFRSALAPTSTSINLGFRCAM